MYCVRRRRILHQTTINERNGCMEREYKMSAARAQELQEELNYLKTTRSDEVAEQIKIARGFGDLSENSEYDEAKNEQGKLYSRIAELEEILHRYAMYYAHSITA